MSLKPELMNAILAMDSYNRGYDASVELTNNAVGNAQIMQTMLDGITVNLDSIIMRDPVTGERVDDDIGFYAVAYDVGGAGAIISFRGTDSFNPDLSNPLFLPDDVFHGWSLGVGNPTSEQGQMALDFYDAVSLITTGPILSTGHSLGGGLAGVAMVLGTTYDKASNDNSEWMNRKAA